MKSSGAPHQSWRMCKSPDCHKMGNGTLKGYCIRHARHMVGQDVVKEFDKKRKARPSSKCKFSECSKHQAVKGYCIRHARDQVNDEAIQAELTRRDKKRKAGPGSCLVPECSKRADVNGYCGQHAQEMLETDVYKGCMEEKKKKKKKKKNASSGRSTSNTSSSSSEQLRTSLEGIDPELPIYKLLSECREEGPGTYKLQEQYGLVDLEQAALMLTILCPLLQQKGCSTTVPDNLMQNISSICKKEATSKRLREVQESLRVWEQGEAAKLGVGGGDDRTRLHMYASTVSAAFVSAVVSYHGHKATGTSGKSETFTCNEQEFTMSKSSLCTLSWMCGVSGRYTLVDNPHDFIDALALARHMSERTEAGGITAAAMSKWRDDADEHVVQKVPDPNARECVNLVLDSFAVPTGHADEGKQGDRGGGYILAHSAKTGSEHAPGNRWQTAYTVCQRQLRAIDLNHGTNLVERAAEAWKGPKSLNGKATSGKMEVATTSLYFGRTFVLRVLYPDLPPQLANHKINIWPCPTGIWGSIFATPLVFSVIDSVLCGYVNSRAKATELHMVDYSSRADMPEFSSLQRNGSAFHRSKSQPPQSSDDTPSEYQLAQEKTLLSTEAREDMIAQRGPFLEALREFISEHLTRTGPMEQVLAEW